MSREKNLEQYKREKNLERLYMRELIRLVRAREDKHSSRKMVVYTAVKDSIHETVTEVLQIPDFAVDIAIRNSLTYLMDNGYIKPTHTDTALFIGLRQTAWNISDKLILR